MLGGTEGKGLARKECTMAGGREVLWFCMYWERHLLGVQTLTAKALQRSWGKGDILQLMEEAPTLLCAAGPLGPAP